MQLKAGLLVAAALGFLSREAMATEYYFLGAGGAGFYGSNAPTMYYDNAKVGAKTASTSAAPAIFQLGGGVWLTDSLGVELDWEFGPVSSLAATYTNATIAESINLGAFLVAPMFRWPIGDSPAAVVLAAPLGWEYVMGSSAITNNGAHTYDIAGGTFTYGGMARIEFGRRDGIFGYLGGGYMAADMPNFKYTSSTSAGGSNQALTDALNKNTGANASGGRMLLGVGYRFGRGDAAPAGGEVGMASNEGEVAPDSTGTVPAKAFYEAEEAFDKKAYARAAELYGMVPASSPRVVEAQTKRGLSLWWAKDLRGADEAFQMAVRSGGEWGNKAAGYLQQLRKGAKK